MMKTMSSKQIQSSVVALCLLMMAGCISAGTVDIYADTTNHISFDVSRTEQTFLGFGAQIWAYGNNTEFPKLAEYRRQVLDELNIKYVRIMENSPEATWKGVKNTRAMTDEFGIKWVLMVWYGPAEYDTPERKLDNVEGFASWWVSILDSYRAHGIEPEYIELMNEPDSGGAWGTGITAEQYNMLVKDLRKKMDDAGYRHVGIVGPGPASLWNTPAYISAMDDEAAVAMAAWSTHAWGTDARGGLRRGGPNTERNFAIFRGPAEDKNPGIPLFVTEYSSHATTFHGKNYPHGDRYGEWDDTKVFPYFSAMNAMGYGTIVYENTLALLNAGAEAPFIWQAIDEPTETNPPGYTDPKRKAWGLLDLWGKPKPVYLTLKTLYPHIPVGSKVIKAPNQDNNAVYAGALTDGTRIVIGVSNTSDEKQTAKISLKNAPEGLSVEKVLAVEQTYWGDPDKGEPDKAQIVEKDVSMAASGKTEYGIEVTLPVDGTLTIILKTDRDV